MAIDTYGKVAKRHDFAPRRRPQEPPPVAPRSLTLADPRVEQPSVSRSYLVPSFKTAKKGESEALEVLAHILGNGSNSRLYSELVMGKGTAVAAGAWYDSTAIDNTSFGIYGAPRPGVSLPDLEKQIDGVLASIIEKGVSAEELERAKTRLIADAIYAADSQATLARWYGTTLSTGGSVDDIKSWPDRIKAVTANAVQEAARSWLQKRRSVTGYLVKEAAPDNEKAEQPQKKEKRT
jgi:zinc protease